MINGGVYFVVSLLELIFWHSLVLLSLGFLILQSFGGLLPSFVLFYLVLESLKPFLWLYFSYFSVWPFNLVPRWLISDLVESFIEFSFRIGSLD